MSDFVAGLVDRVTKPFRKPEGYTSAVQEQKAAAAPAAAAPAAAPKPAIGGVNLGVMKKREEAAGLADGGIVGRDGYKRNQGTYETDEVNGHMKTRPLTFQGSNIQEGANRYAGPDKPSEAGAGRGVKNPPRVKGYRQGGLVEGAGTGTSDSIPKTVEKGTHVMPADSTEQVRLSKGEVELPPEALMAVGAAAMEAFRAATHRESDAPADGGSGVPTEGMGAQDPGFKHGGHVGKKPGYADGGLVLEEDKPGGAVYGMYPSAAGTRRTTYAQDARLRTGTLADGSTPPPMDVGGQRGLPSGVQPSAAGAGRGVMNPPAANPVPVAAAVAPGAAVATPNAQDTLMARASTPQATATPGVGMLTSPGMGPVFTNVPGTTTASMTPGAISPQADAAAGNLAARYAPPAAPTSYRTTTDTVPGITNPGNTLPAGAGALISPDRQAERNAEFDRQTLRDRGARRGGRAGAALIGSADLQEQNLARATEGAGNRVVDQQRIASGEKIATSRDGLEAQRNAVGAAEAASRIGVNNAQAGSAQYLARLNAQYAQATDPKVRETLRAQILLQQGKDPAQQNRYTVVPGGQEVVDGQSVRSPSMVLDNQSGQFVQAPGATTKAAPAAGTVKDGYRFKGGNPADKNAWEKV